MKMKTHTHIALWGVAIVSIGIIGAGCQNAPEAETGDQTTSPPRLIALEGQPNFRDLGGYRTKDGRTVKWRQVFRSGELPRLTDEDVATLDDLGIRTVVDFLTKAEIAERGEDRLPYGVRKVPLPMEAGNMGELTAVVAKARRTGDFTSVPPEINPDIHRRLIKEGREYYSALLRELIDPANRPLAFHCSHGIHRTGTGAAILLSALGVPWETIREDYLLSNDTRSDEIQRRLNELKQMDAKNRGIPAEEVDTTNMEAFYILDGSYIDASLDAAVEEFGSMDAYLRKGLGLTEVELESLREGLLE